MVTSKQTEQIKYAKERKLLKEQNAVIRDFMGTWKGWNNYGADTEYVNGATGRKAGSDVKYHESWDLLMPAFKRFKDVFNGTTSDANTETFFRKVADILHSISSVNIEGAYIALYFAIKWYNELKVVKVCPKCGSGGTKDICPHASELSQDDTPCNCCESCRDNCANDI